MKTAAFNQLRRLHAVLTILCWLVPVGSAIYILFVYRSMPAVVGYHFAGDGTFDLFGGKEIAFIHPMAAEVLMLVLLTPCGRAAYRLRHAKRLTVLGNQLVAHTAAYLCTVLTICWEILFSQWIVCVAAQRPMPTQLLHALLLITSAAFVIAGGIWIAAACVLRVPREKQDDETFHNGV